MTRPRRRPIGFRSLVLVQYISLGAIIGSLATLGLLHDLALLVGLLSCFWLLVLWPPIYYATHKGGS